MNRVAVVDIGSNTLKLLVAEESPKGLKALAESVREVRISEGIVREAGESRLAELSMQRAAQAAAELCAEAARWEPAVLEIVATSAVRDASNAPAFIEAVHQTTGVAVQVLSGEEEAEGIAEGVAQDAAVTAFSHFLIADLGGGSLELIERKEESNQQALSLPLGAVRLLHSLVDEPEAPLGSEERDGLRVAVKRTLEQSDFKVPQEAPRLIGTGGVFSIARLMLGGGVDLTDLPETPPELRLADLHALEQRLWALTLEARRLQPGLPPSRADIMPIGLLVLTTLAEVVGSDRFTHSLCNLRYGRAAQLLNSVKD